MSEQVIESKEVIMEQDSENTGIKKIAEINGIPKPKRLRGRPKGAWSYSHREVRELAQMFGPEAIGKLVNIMRKGETETVQIAAAKELLTRGFGNSVVVSGPNDGPIPVTYEGLTSTIHGLLGEILGPDVVAEARRVVSVQ